ncbi:TetR/AcrR family transcriptional regulator [Hansschlegelia plantiphila]|uniref:HTH tetR-type domain-containing protein n=1 Tax=Hansschlegelia plantiphila TaxID=374655 RepID=A0A9W6J1T5_9HYPH|nr:TetR/AcrR family transcriptional regulator [Hansschlegelia plantiphila]GLK69255.1 hypothetical protein GCM10008179_28930 [Hansschlegelia plantiphila]
MPLTLERRPGYVTRDLILAAAIERFSKNSYEETKLRDLASDVAVDVSYVHRCFGSKEDLFVEALKEAFRPERFIVGDGDELKRNLAQSVIEEPLYPAAAEVNPFEIMVRSLNSEQARPILRQLLFTEFVEPLSVKLKAPALQRAALISAALAGIRLFRDVLDVDSIFKDRPDDFRRLVEAVLEACLACAAGETETR